MPAARSSAICRLAMSTALPRRLSSVSCALWIAPQVGTHSMWLRTQLWMTTGVFLSSSALARMSGAGGLVDGGVDFVGVVFDFALRLVVAGQDFCADLLCLKRLALGREVGQDGIGVCVDGAEQRA